MRIILGRAQTAGHSLSYDTSCIEKHTDASYFLHQSYPDSIVSILFVLHTFQASTPTSYSHTARAQPDFSCMHASILHPTIPLSSPPLTCHNKSATESPSRLFLRPGTAKTNPSCNDCQDCRLHQRSKRQTIRRGNHDNQRGTSCNLHLTRTPSCCCKRLAWVVQELEQE